MGVPANGSASGVRALPPLPTVAPTHVPTVHAPSRGGGPPQACPRCFRRGAAGGKSRGDVPACLRRRRPWEPFGLGAHLPRAPGAARPAVSCPVSTEGWTRRVHFVREGGGVCASLGSPLSLRSLDANWRGGHTRQHPLAMAAMQSHHLLVLLPKKSAAAAALLRTRPLLQSGRPLPRGWGDLVRCDEPLHLWGFRFQGVNAG